MIIPVQVEQSKYFKSCLEILKPVLNLSSREADVVAYLLGFFHRYNASDRDIVGRAAFSAEMRRQICRELKMSKQNLNNLFFKLREKKVIVGDGLTPFLYRTFPTGIKGDITYKLEIIQDKIRSEVVS